MIYLGSDHGGFKLKEKVRIHLTAKGIAWEDIGTFSDKKKVDYPDYGIPLAKKVVKNKAKGILCCTNGVGVCIAANRVKGARAYMPYDKFTAVTGKADDDPNIICLRGLKTTPKKQLQLIDFWLNTKFKSHEPRRMRRIRKLDK
jgi:ribose 5-phosphate isomerase B